MWKKKKDWNLGKRSGLEILKVSTFTIMRLNEITKGVSTDKEDQGLSPGRKQQRRLRSSSQRDQVQGLPSFPTEVMSDLDKRSLVKC